MSVMGHPKYENVSGKIILLNDEACLEGDILGHLKDKEVGDLNCLELTQLDVTLRAKFGIFVAFQNIPEIVGVKLFEFLRTIYNARW